MGQNNVARATDRAHAEAGDDRAKISAYFTQKLSFFIRPRSGTNRWQSRRLEPVFVVFDHAWRNGETGLPFVDACMRYLAATGWLNFRMRAMVASVAAYHLWLDWRAPGFHLARMFTDYEPGIHWSQIQMQSGTTGINSVRIYNPIKQGLDQDPTGDFVRRWVPELGTISGAKVHTPWKSDQAGKILDRSYPLPIVDHLSARDKV